MVEMFSGSAYNTQNSCQPKLWLANTNEGPLRNWSAFREWIRSSVFPNDDQFTNRIFWSRSNVACEQALRGAGGKRKESLQLRLWNLNICIEKVDAKCWLAETTLVMMSLPLARVFQCLFTFAPVLPFPAPPPERPGELARRLGVMTHLGRGFASLF